MRDAEDWACEFLGTRDEVLAGELAALITAARREGAEYMREKNATWVLKNPNASAWETAQAFRALPLPGDE